MTDLEDGFYWVLVCDEWSIAEKETVGIATYWWFRGSAILKSDIQEIDPRRIEREGEKK